MTGARTIIPLTVAEITQEMARQLPTVPRNSMNPPVQPVKKQGGVVNVPVLLSLDGEAFVIAAYAEILGREPDAEGLQTHLQMLAGGHDKQSIILSMRASGEGDMYNSVLVGVRHPGRLDRIFALPVAGRFIRRIVTRLPSYRLRQAVIRLEDHVSVLEHRQPETATKTATEMRFDALSARLDSARNRLDDQQKAAEASLNRLYNKAVEQLAREPWAEPLLCLADRQDAINAKIDTISQAVRDVGLVNEAVRLLTQAFGPVAEGAGWQDTGAALVARAAEALRLQEGRIYHAERLAQAATEEMRVQSQRLNLLLETVRRRAEPLDERQTGTLLAEQDHLLDSLYVDFEARFRGSRALIKDRQRVHLPVMVDAGAGAAARPIVDVGAGRGEWLELLGEQGLTAYGIDLNVAMAKTCIELGLTCIAGDAVAELAQLKEGSVGAVTGFHIIEHLPFRVMVALLDEALRVLAPGGVILFETPNPANMQVGSRFFYLDPTHHNPIPGEMVAMVAEARGFVRVRIEPLHPMTETFDAVDKILGAQLDALMHGPMDYALIAYKA